MYGLIIDFRSKAEPPMIWLGCRNLWSFSAPWSRMDGPRIRHLDHIRDLFMRAGAAALTSHRPPLGSGSREQDLGVVREAA
jgi:hypothetical protein